MQLGDSDSPRLDAELLLGHVLAKPRSYLFSWPERELDAATLAQFEALLRQRVQGMPVAYLLGYREFWGLELQVSPATLIPRPDTERLVELALERIALDKPARILDLGTGTGAIALAIASERPLAQVLAADISPAALTLAKANCERLGFKHVECVLSDWFSAIPSGSRFDLIISNPPYIPDSDPHLQQGDVRFEPRSALAAGDDGLADIRHLLEQAPRFLQAEGWLLFEHGYDQGAATTHLLQAAGYRQVQCHQDWAGHDRVSGGLRPA